MLVYMKKKLKISIPLTIVPKTFKYLGINSTKIVKYLNNEIYRTLNKERGQQQKGKIFHVHGLGELIPSNINNIKGNL